MARGLMYGSYRKPRELTWIFGVLIYLCLMAEAFFGYLLPWGQMSFWGAQVIINLFATIPVIGEDLVGLDPRRLQRLGRDPQPLLRAARDRDPAWRSWGWSPRTSWRCTRRARTTRTASRSTRTSTRRPGTPVDGIPFHPYYTVKDIVGRGGLPASCSAAIVFFSPEMGGYFLEYNNFVPADPLTTPAHIAPVWYFTPFYAMLRAVPSVLRHRRSGAWR